jgi:GTP-dependent dephospho-CoA kinase
MANFCVSDALRKRLKKPFGILVSNDNICRISGIHKGKKLISVGDATLSSLKGLGITPNMVIVDNVIGRKRIEPIKHNATKTFRFKNPAGTLTKAGWKTIAQAMKHDSAKIVVEGEEDLTAILAVHEAPLGSVVMYGQPKKGIVVVKVTESRKKRVKKMMDAIFEKQSST